MMVLLALHIFELSAQQNYKDISAGQRVSILSEAFDNNSNGWITDNSFVSGKFVNGYFDIACVYSLKKENAKSLEFLEKAFKLNYSGDELSSTDLDNIRDTREFKDLTSKYLKK